MQTKTRDIYTTIRTEGAILPTDILQRIAEGDGNLDGLKPSDYHLPEGEKLREAISHSWNSLLGRWNSYISAVNKLPEGDAGTTVTREKWLLPLLQELGYGRLPTSKAVEMDGKSYPISHTWQSTPIHLIGCWVDIDKRTKGVAGAAQISPHGMIQEFLNKSDDHLWAFLSNGQRFRILRDNASLTRQAYVEFDIAGMMEGEVYSDFVLLWLLCHQSRVEAEIPEKCWLEIWSQTAQQQGTRALDQLRKGVEAAISSLGSGFLSHKANTELKEKLKSGVLDKQDYYRQLLRMVYRLVFIFVAEDRGMLLDPNAGLTARDTYMSYYSASRLRRLAEKKRGTQHYDLWQGLSLVFEKLGSDTGCSDLALPPLGSYLWSKDAIVDMDGCEISNRDLLEAIRPLVLTTEKNVRRVVDYKNLGAEELGSIYESLLELHPDINVDAGTFKLSTVSGHERKTTGSYYTPTSLINCLLDSALDPVLKEASKKKDEEQAILNLKVCDPACGSGHFLVAAAHRMAKRLAAVRTGDDEPSPEAHRTALREIIGRCIYGVDLNPMAVELCKVSLWMEALEPGKPLSFLDHHIQSGNSLLGTTPVLLANGIPDEAFNPIEGDDKKLCAEFKKKNKAERAGQLSLFDADDRTWEHLGNLAANMMRLEEISDDTVDGLKHKQETYEQLMRSSSYEHGRFVADAWCAAFVWKKTKEFAYPVTQDVLRQIEHNPQSITVSMKQEISRLANQYQFFHWHLAFPDVFRVPGRGEEPDNEQTGWSGGFDVVLGNPPWDTLSPDAKEFFASYDPQVRFQDRDGQQRIINELLQNPTIAQRWQANCRDLYALVLFIKQSGRYKMFAPGNLGKGDFNVYRMFVEAALSLTHRNGWASQIVPEGLYNGANCMAIRRALYGTCRLDRVYGFENANEVWFSDIDTRMKFCLYAAHLGLQTESFRAAFNIRSLNQLAEVEARRSLHIPVHLVKEFSPDALAIMELGNQMDIDIAEKMYRWPPFGDEAAGPPRRVYMREIDMGTDRRLFGEDPNGVPLYEGRMVDQFDYRAKGYRSGRGRAAHWEGLPFSNPDKSIQPQWYIPWDRVPDKCRDRISKYHVGFCDVASPTNERTLIAALLPPSIICGDKVPTITFEGDESGWQLVLWVAVANSYAMDFIARKKVSLKMSYTIVDSLPFPRLNREDHLAHGLVSRCLRLSCTGPELIPFWNRLAAEGWVSATSSAIDIPGELDDNVRLQLRAEIDAIVARDLFALTRPELEYILTTFPTQQRYQEQKYGEFRSRRLIIEAFDYLPM
ncbi:MAG: N-6 DNA methylase [Planctomycetes bacterium]|nr:N-6 DNA methylase [Planctomycetota bacterium]